MIPVCRIYDDFKGASNTWQNGHFRPKSFEYALHEASIEIFNELKKEWEKSQIVSDHLRPFFKTVQVPIKDYPRGGMIDYPKDYSMFSTLRFYSKSVGTEGVICEGVDMLDKEEKVCRPLREEEKEENELKPTEDLAENEIKKIDNQRWASFYSHEFLKPSLENAGCTQYNSGFKVLPRKIGYAVLDYLAIPERPKFVYKKGLRNEFTCVPEQCSNMLWNDEILPELMSRLKTKYASFTGNSQKYAEGVKETEKVGS